MRITYPFRPKSNQHLISGQYWTIPLKSGIFACGRVIEIDPNNSRGFLAGLMDWVGNNPPTYDELAGHNTIAQGAVHIKTIHETGIDGMILGHRPLDLDNIESDFFRSQNGFDPVNCKLLKGFKELRPIMKEEWEKYSTLTSWGYNVIKILAERYFSQGS